MRAIWTGSLSFGLINIPVKMYSASETRGGIDLHMLHKTDLSPVRYAKICRQDEKEISFNEIVKGYEYQDGEFVVVSDEDFEKANAHKTKTVEIQQFTNQSELDIRYFEKPYYLEPDKGSDKPYALLWEALSRSRKLAVARFVLRNREHLAAIKPVGRALVLNQMRFPSDLRSPADLHFPDEKTTEKREVDMALKLIDQLTQPFIPEDFHDTYTEELEKLIEAKIHGRAPKTKSQAPVRTESKDLMAALKASLEQEQKRTTAR